MSRRRLLDSAVLLYAVGEPHPHQAACRALLEAAGRGDVELHVSAEAVQEFLFHRMRRVTRAEAVAQARDVLELCVVHPFEVVVVERALEVVESSPLRGRDAVHAATALVHGFDAIVSPDNDFDEAPGLHRLEPADA